ncbi:MAG TPA: hypothetical protein VJ715_07045 [Pyrinomonadaceae bacterium]|nr:hypothetical protein [Pyrinomonadaceae bacterium]
MNTKLRSLVLSLLLTAAVSVATVSAQTATPAATTTTTTTAPAESGALSALPASDLVIYANMRRIMTELAPHIMAHDPSMLAKVMGAIEMVKAKTGVNVMGIERVAVGLRLLGPIGPEFKKENLGIVIIAYGDFDANAFTTFAKAETKGKMSEQTYGGKIVYSEPAPEPPKTKSERERPAFAVLDANTLAIGDLVEVRAAVDAAAGTGRLDPALARLATEDENALVGVGVNFSPAVAQHLGASVGPDEVVRAGVRLLVSTVKQMSLSAGVGPGTFNMTMGMRFCDAQQAQGVGDVLKAVHRKVAADEPKVRGLLEGVQVTTDGSDVRVRAEIKGEALRSLGQMFADKREGATTSPPPVAAPPPATETQTAPVEPGIKPPTNKATKRRRARRRGR